MNDFADRIHRLSPAQRELLLDRLRRQGAVPAAAAPIPRRSDSGPAPLSFAQQRLWFMDQLQQERGGYQIVGAMRLAGPLDRAALEQSLIAIVRRHEVLRTSFPAIAGQPVQVVGAAAECPLPLVDLRALPEDERESALRRYLQEEQGRGFDLAHGPLLRARLFQMTEQQHVLVLSLHHIVADGWSSGILRRELAECYAAYRGGQVPQLPELPVQYADFAQWQRDWLQGEVLQQQLAYWRRRLAFLPALVLPTDRPRASALGGRGGVEVRWLPAGLQQAVQEFNRREGVTLYMSLLAAFQIVLSRSSGQTDIVLGTPLANRNRSELEGLIGFFVNTLVMRTDLAGNPTCRELLRRVRDMAMDAYANQDVPFERVVEELHPERALERHPLFQVAFAVQNAPRERLELAGLALSPLEPDVTTTRFDLELHVWEHARGIRLVAAYNADLFRAESIARLLQQMETVVQGILANPETPIQQLSLLTPRERHQILVDWNATATPFPRDASLAELFEAQAAQRPDAVSVVWEGGCWTYRELNQQARRIARRLRDLGVGPEVVVGLGLERSSLLIAATLGVLQAGGAYLPLDSSAPPARWARVLAETRARVLLTDASKGGGLSPLPGLEILNLDESQPAGRQSGVEPRRSQGGNLAYVMYTSGSTGQPKGIAVPQRAVARLVLNSNYLRLCPEDGVAWASDFAFDGATFEMWGALLQGARLVLIPKEILLAPSRFREHVGRLGITVAFLTTALFNHLARRAPDLFATLGCVLFGGEVADPSVVRNVLASGKPQRLLHVYGPTESTTFATFHDLASLPADATAVPIGRPLANTEAYVLDAEMNPVPVGVAGQLYLGGDGLARGYVRDARRTAARFVPHPFSSRPGSRLYATGDLVRLQAEGELVFLGREDHQIKLRGFRIELGEIEAALRRHPDVQEAVVLLHKDGGQEPRLVAWVQRSNQASATPEALLRHARETLPAYMVPGAITCLATLPLNIHGKIDRGALAVTAAALAGSEGREGAANVPRTPVEEALTEIFRDVLGRQAVPRQESFFDLGGHSLLATQLVSRLRDVFQIELPLSAVFRAPSVEALAVEIERVLRADESPAAAPLLPVSRDRVLTASFAQQRLWFLQRLQPDDGAWHVPWIVELRGHVDVLSLQRSFDALVRRHESLRTRFAERDGRPVQVIDPEGSCPLQVLDLRASPERHEAVRRRALAEQREPFDLARGPLMRAHLLRLEDELSVLCVTLHHIVSDGWSLGVLGRELGACYAAFQAGHSPSLPDLPVQYADFAQWQHDWLRGDVLQRHLNYWRLLTDLPLLRLPTDRPRSRTAQAAGAIVGRELPAATTQALRELNRREGVTLYMSLLAAFQLLLFRHTGQTDFAVGTPVANRNRSELEGLIGFFVNSLVMRTDLSGDPPLRELLRRVRTTSLEAYAHQDLPFERLVQELNPDRHPNRHPLFQVVFAVQNASREELQLSGLSVRPLEFEVTTARYDLQLDVWEYPDRLRLTVFFDSSLFDRATVQRLLDRLEILLEGIVANPDRRLSEYPLLIVEEQRWLAERNSPPFDAAPPAGVTERSGRQAEADAGGPPGASSSFTGGTPAGAEACRMGMVCLHESFQSHARQTPDAVAVVSGEGSWTYGELDAWSNRVAQCLRRRKVDSEVKVAVCLERSAALVAGILGVLKAGGAYVALEPSWPDQRLRHILAETAAPVLVTQRSLLGRLQAMLQGIVTPACGPDLLCVDDAEVASADARCPANRATPENLAYVMYTSGSTGRPKGVLVTHRNVARLLAATRAWFSFSGNDVWTLFHSVAFDFSVWEFWGALLHGGRLVVVPYLVSRSPAEFRRWLAEHQVTVLNQTPTAFRQLAAVPGVEPLSLRYVIFGGELLDPASLGAWWEQQASRPRLVNMYGITETTVHVTYAPLDPGDARPYVGSPIGVRIPDLRLYLLDEQGRQVPIGVFGELYVGGPGLARGYLNAPALTAEKFVPDDFSGLPGERLYRSGDLARYREDGTLEFLGRRDRQVKLRGFRVELGEIEAVLREHDAVHEAVVMEREDTPGDRRLVAYVVADADRPRIRQQVSAEKSRLVGHWRALYDEIYRGAAAVGDPEFNLAGWISSYTGEPIPVGAMREQVEQTVAKILAHRPQRVLEIGCGTGLLLYRLAPCCEEYWGTDVSSVALERLRQRLPDNVTLWLREAGELSGIAAQSLDCIVLNSVVQYFPEVDYLETVLQRARDLVRPGGLIFVGDVRNVALWSAFQTAVELHQAEPNCPLRELRDRIKQHRDQETELLIDPGFFLGLPERMLGITDAWTEPKRGRDRNELTQFRYDAMLRVGPAAPRTELSLCLDWRQRRWSSAEIGSWLQQQSPQAVGLLNVANARVQAAVNAVEMFERLPAETPACELRRLVEQQVLAEGGVEPEDLWALSRILPYGVAIRWSGGRARGDFDVAFLPQAGSAAPAWPAFPGPGRVRSTPALTATSPWQPPFAGRLARELREDLQRRLPDYMVPTTVVMLERLPLTDQGKLDRRALPVPEAARPELETRYTAPRSPLEVTLAVIWSDVLRLRQIGIHDNFFDLGGHSLLATQVVARVREACQVDLPLRMLFESPTIADLAVAVALQKARQTNTAILESRLAELEQQ